MVEVAELGELTIAAVVDRPEELPIVADEEEVVVEEVVVVRA